MNTTANQSVSIDTVEPANHARRDMFRMAGAGGVNGVMEFMNRELANTVLHSGVESIGKLNESHVKRTAA
ncbi:hypothetical protein ACSBPU_00165 [Parapusillimonas sp. JC17]|uniref:hypothetical protein n=1 Tax=Parapusillimonas sp. JC17 TaxID=3445768 RepID=UPI003F9ED70D